MSDNEFIPEVRRITLHPVDADGAPDLSINLYPKALFTGIVDELGEPVDIALQDELDHEKIRALNAENNLALRLSADEAIIETKADNLTQISGYDATKVQSLKNINGTIQWVDD